MLNIFTLIVSLVFLLATAGVVLIGIFKSRKVQWRYSLSKIIITIVCAVVSMLLCAFLSYILAMCLQTSVMDILISNIPEMSDIEFTDDIITALLGFVIAPILFIPIFICCRVLMGYCVAPLNNLIVRLTDKENRDREKVTYKNAKQVTQMQESSKTSALCGTISAVLVFFVICAPIVFGVSNIASISAAAVADCNTESKETAYKVSLALSDNAATVMLTVFGGNALFDGLTTYPVADGFSNLDREVESVSSIVTAINVMRSDGEYDGERVQKTLNRSSKNIQKTIIIPTLIPQVLDQATDKWDKGEKFFGIEDIRNEEYLTPIITDILEILQNKDTDEIKEDIGVVLKIVGLLAHDGSLFDAAKAPDKVFSDEEALEEVFLEVIDNQRLRPLLPKITELSINALSTMVSAYQSAEESYQKMLEEILVYAADTRYDYAYIRPVFEEIFDRYGYPNARNLSFSVANTTRASGFLRTKKTIKDLEKSIDFSLKSYKQATQLVFASDITVNSKAKYDSEIEARALAKVFCAVASTYSSMRAEKYPEALGSLGVAFKGFTEMEMVGKENTRLIMMSILQSNKLSKRLGVSGENTILIIDEIIQNDSYEDTLSTLAFTVSIFDKAYDRTLDSKTMEDFLDTTDVLSYRAVSGYITQKLMMNRYGIPERYVSVATSYTVELLDTVLLKKADYMTNGEQFEAELDATCMILRAVLNSSNIQIPTFNRGAEEGVIGLDVDDYVSLMFDSKVVLEYVIAKTNVVQPSVRYNPLSAPLIANNNEIDRIKELIKENYYSADDDQKDSYNSILRVWGQFIGQVFVFVDGEVYKGSL